MLTVMENWDDLNEALSNLEQEDQDAIKQYFNRLVKEEDGLGDILYGTVEDFQQRIAYLQEDDYDTYAKEIDAQEIMIVEENPQQ